VTSLISTLLALLTMGAAGFGATMWVMRGAARLRIFEILALSWFLGTVLVSLSLWGLSFFIKGQWLLLGMAILCGALGIVGFSLARTRLANFELSQPRNLMEWVLTALLFFEIAAISWITFKHTLGWDGLLIWELKARLAFLNGGALPAGYFTDNGRAYSHPEYPLYLPLTEMWLYLCIGQCHQFLAKVIFPIFYFTGMILLVRAGAELSGRLWIGLSIAVLFPLIPLATHFPGIVVGYVDVPLSFLYLAAIYYLLIFTREGSREALVLFIIMASGLPWMKREGAILWPILAVLGAMFIFRRHGLRVAGLSLLPGISIIAAWLIFLRSMHVPHSRDFVPVSFHVLWANLSRLDPVLCSLIDDLSRPSYWSLFWYATAFALICIVFRSRSTGAAILGTCILVPIGLYCATYLFSAWPDLVAHVESSLPRLLLQLVPAGWLAIALAIAPVPRRNSSTIRMRGPLEPRPSARSESGTDCN